MHENEWRRRPRPVKAAATKTTKRPRPPRAVWFRMNDQGKLTQRHWPTMREAKAAHAPGFPFIAGPYGLAERARQE